MRKTTLLYQYYMEEYLVEAINKMEEYYLEAAYKENYYLRDNLLIPSISQTLAKEKIQEKIIDFTGAFKDTHSTQLSTAGPVYIFTFSEKETSFLYELFGLSKEEVLELSRNMIRETYEGTSEFHIIREAPHKILITGMLIEALKKNYEDIVTCCKYLFAFAEYPLIYRVYWKQGVREDIMKHTIEHLPNKYKAKKVNNLEELLMYDTGTALELFRNRLLTEQDDVWISFIYSIRTRINSTFRNIARKYYDNHEKNATQHNTPSQMDDGTLTEIQGHTSNIATIVETTYTKFISNNINEAMAGVTADGNKVDRDILIGYINQIFSTKENRLYKLIENIITAFFLKNPTNTSVGSGEFLNFGLGLYKSIGTSKDPTYEEITNILNMWMNDIINIINHTQNKGTIINYKRSIYNYLILMINHYN